MRSLIATFLLGAVAVSRAAVAQQEEGCSRDADCKDGRICAQRLCVDPPPPKSDGASPQAAAPATYREPIPGAETPTAAQTAKPGDATRRRHLGLFIRPDLGIGFMGTSASSGPERSVSGVAGTVGLAIGGALSEGSILAFHVWDAMIANPSVTDRGTSSTLNGKVGLLALGPEYTAYSKQNVYFSISPAITRVYFLSGSGTSDDTKWGFGVRAAVGREWWVADHWGLGGVVHLSWSFNNASGGDSSTWSTWGLTVAFSATYN